MKDKFPLSMYFHKLNDWIPRIWKMDFIALSTNDQIYILRKNIGIGQKVVKCTDFN